MKGKKSELIKRNGNTENLINSVWRKVVGGIDRTSFKDYEQLSAIWSPKEHDYTYEDRLLRTCGAWKASYAPSSTVLKWKECDVDLGLRWAIMQPGRNSAKRRSATNATLFSFFRRRHAISTIESEIDMATWAAPSGNRRIGGWHG
jgi:hypothetical protein